MTSDSTPAPRYVVHTGLGLPIACDERVSPAIEAGIRAGWYEKQEIDLAVGLIGPGDRVLELGGGLGAAAAYLWNRCGPDSYTVFEANPQIVPLLRRTLARNGAGAVDVRTELLTRDPVLTGAHRDFYVADEFWVSSTVRPDGSSRSCKVPTLGFLDFLEEYRPSVVLSDIEGGELELFGDLDRDPGMRRTRPFLDDLRAVTMELHPETIGESGVAEIRRAFGALGFEEKIIRRHGCLAVFSNPAPGGGRGPG